MAQAKQQVQAKQHQMPTVQAVSIVLIETNGTIKTLKTKEVSPETLYKKCGFRNGDDFACRHTWKGKLKGESYRVAVWAKKTGKANFENKYDFPPPVDKELFFGQCAVVRLDASGAFVDLTKETWLKIYEHLFGGFEDLGDEDEFSEDELADVDPALLTAHGYLKDDFVVSDKEAIDSAETSEAASEAEASEAEASEVASEAAESEAEASEAESEASEAEAKAIKKGASKKDKKIVKKVAPKKGKKKAEPVEEDIDTSELEEEVYTFSDDD